MLALKLAEGRTLSEAEMAQALRALAEIPDKVRQVLTLDEEIRRIAHVYRYASNFLYLGRGYNFPVALEGALKLKEISYIHAEGYPAAEMKHGPIALIDRFMPVVFIAMKDRTYDKVVSNIEEVVARQFGHRHHRRRQRRAGQALRVRHPHSTGAGLPDAAPDGDSAATAGLSYRRHAGVQRGSAAQPGQERDGGVADRHLQADRGVSSGNEALRL